MPPREPQALLEDALAQIADLQTKVATGSLDELLGSRDLQAIFERRFEVLGEALRRLERADPTVFGRITGAREAVDMRNLIIHGYDGVDHRILWSTALHELPAMRDSLERELQGLLGT